MMKAKTLLLSLLLLFASTYVHAWGFKAHKHINRCAVFTLPPALFTFYKHYIGYITEQAVNPDKRRYVVEGEESKHFIDLDHYETPPQDFPRDWDKAIAQYSAETIQTHGILPWNICTVKRMLTHAFKTKSLERILKLSADLGHYIADANVPLHTSKNYDGQLTGQEGIHGLWESRLPELFQEQYDCFVGEATYVASPLHRVWEAVLQAHQLVDRVLTLEKELGKTSLKFHKFSYEKKGTTLGKVYSKDYATAYHESLEGQVEEQMRASIKMVGDFWFTCWVDAGKPNLDDLLVSNPAETIVPEEISTTGKTTLSVRACCCH